MKANMEKLTDAEAALLEYIERYGLTERARAYFRGDDFKARGCSSSEDLKEKTGN
ncbi:hypothetical protein KO491_08830 [Roseovarius nubinhibens]|uniref:hypothetical protein n=1 Tax=Roseovarius nubinhibens TaxID=314263 RepID=UPI001C08A0B1|nr:hypothetical protein [Roseovarius nubinhibens]MBU2999942.1 hypothetical protein [Roseovarius nubinhibens]